MSFILAFLLCAFGLIVGGILIIRAFEEDCDD